MEGYLTHGNDLYLSFYCNSDPSLLLFCVDLERPYPSNLFKNYTKGDYDEFWPSINCDGDAI